MTDPQFAELIHTLQPIAERASNYTLTGAADWPLLLVCGGVIGAVIAAMWIDLKSVFKEHKGENEKGHDMLWAETRAIKKEMKDCQEKCWGDGK